jgi:5-hydroxyisourate hydrolase
VPVSISTHVLDAALGRPAAGVAVTLEGPGGLSRAGVTDDDGRIGDLAPGALPGGVYRLRFATGDYHAATGQDGFYPEVVVAVTVDADRPHTHVPLLLSPFAYSTYRGS